MQHRPHPAPGDFGSSSLWKIPPSRRPWPVTWGGSGDSSPHLLPHLERTQPPSETRQELPGAAHVSQILPVFPLPTPLSPMGCVVVPQFPQGITHGAEADLMPPRTSRRSKTRNKP
ncbi:hypothetical protein RLOC_00010638 [Lonchura striata]|uniref:Uncharacterized protein n=1 Tax=Lonchura striata TaxID=40157 RepID=A0A218UEB5_9PASE|nr:hypothetical protein RLOC_00010638 [Lonchura striata domestica]